MFDCLVLSGLVVLQVGSDGVLPSQPDPYRDRCRSLTLREGSGRFWFTSDFDTSPRPALRATSPEHQGRTLPERPHPARGARHPCRDPDCLAISAAFSSADRATDGCVAGQRPPLVCRLSPPLGGRSRSASECVARRRPPGQPMAARFPRGDGDRTCERAVVGSRQHQRGCPLSYLERDIAFWPPRYDFSLRSHNLPRMMRA